MLRVTVKHFGPIREADVTLGRLTVFIGPNNAGKSYMAMLLYALLRLFGRRAPRFLEGGAGVSGGTSSGVTEIWVGPVG